MEGSKGLLVSNEPPKGGINLSEKTIDELKAMAWDLHIATERNKLDMNMILGAIKQKEMIAKKD